MGRPFRLLILSDGKPGHLNQSIGIAERLAEMVEVERLIVEVRHKSKLRDDLLRVAMRLLGWAPLPGKLVRFTLSWSLTDESFGSLPLEGRFDLILSTGSSVAPVNLLLGKLLKAPSAVSLRPSPTGIAWFDLVILPKHLWPRIPRGNVFKAIGVPNRITPQRLDALRERLAGEMALLPRRRVGVLLGGEDRYNTISPRTAERLISELKALLEEIDGELTLTTSRRTPPEVEGMVEEAFEGDPRCKVLALVGRGRVIEEAVLKILAISDLVIVTEDSMSMVSEAASSGRRVIILKVDRKRWIRPRRTRMYEEICRRTGAVYCGIDELKRAALELLSEEVQVGALRDAEGAARQILRRFGGRGHGPPSLREIQGGYSSI